MSEIDAIQKLFSEAALQGWMSGHLDAAKSLLMPVLKEAQANRIRNPDDAATSEAIERLMRAINDIDNVSKPLHRAASGGKI